MAREEVEALWNRVMTRSGTLKSVLKAEGVAYSTYNYWVRRNAYKRSTSVCDYQSSTYGAVFFDFESFQNDLESYIRRNIEKLGW